MKTEVIKKFNEEVADNLRRLRHWKGYTQQKMADEIGIPQKNYAKYEEGRNSMPLEVAAIICNVFSITIDDLVVRFGPAA